MVFALRNAIRLMKTKGNLYEEDRLFMLALQPELPKLKRRRSHRLFGLL